MNQHICRNFVYVESIETPRFIQDDNGPKLFEFIFNQVTQIRTLHEDSQDMRAICQS